MIRKSINSIMLLFCISCSIYQDNETPEIFFHFSNFEILKLGKKISDMITSNNNDYVYLSDYNNNSVLKINTNNSLSLQNMTIVGSNPIAMDLNSDNSILAITHQGESTIHLIDTESMNINQTFSVSLMNMNDLVFINDSIIIISSETDPSCIILNLNSGQELSQSVLNGEFAMDKEKKILYVATSSSIKKYNWDGNRFYQDPNISDPYGFTGKIHHLVYNYQKEIIFISLSDENNDIDVKHVYSYNGNDMTSAGKYQINSAGLATAISQDGERIFVAPTDADEMGVFIVEFSQNTKLENNYYLSAGNLAARGMVLDTNQEYLYILVNIPGDDDSFEPYNDYSFDLQRIALNVPEDI